MLVDYIKNLCCFCCYTSSSNTSSANISPTSKIISPTSKIYVVAGKQFGGSRSAETQSSEPTTPETKYPITVNITGPIAPIFSLTTPIPPLAAPLTRDSYKDAKEIRLVSALPTYMPCLNETKSPKGEISQRLTELTPNCRREYRLELDKEVVKKKLAASANEALIAFTKARKQRQESINELYVQIVVLQKESVRELGCAFEKFKVPDLKDLTTEAKRQQNLEVTMNGLTNGIHHYLTIETKESGIPIPVSLSRGLARVKALYHKATLEIMYYVPKERYEPEFAAKVNFLDNSASESDHVNHYPNDDPLKANIYRVNVPGNLRVGVGEYRNKDKSAWCARTLFIREGATRIPTRVELRAIFNENGKTKNCAIDAKNKIYNVLVKKLEYYSQEKLDPKVIIRQALKEALPDLSRELDSFYGGVTTCMGLYFPDKKWLAVANLGVSRAIVVKANGDTIPLSREQSLTDPILKREIARRGGHILHKKLEDFHLPRSLGRHGIVERIVEYRDVDGKSVLAANVANQKIKLLNPKNELPISSTIIDKPQDLVLVREKIRPTIVSARPDVIIYENFKSEDIFVIFNGVHVNSDQVGSLVHAKKEKSLEEAAADITAAAKLARFKGDIADITVMLSKFSS